MIKYKNTKYNFMQFYFKKLYIQLIGNVHNYSHLNQDITNISQCCARKVCISNQKIT